MRTQDLDYSLPPERIAHTPTERREDARLMVCRLSAGSTEHRRVSDLPDVLRPGDLLVLNQTRVLPARFECTRDATGGRVEGLFIAAPEPRIWRVMLKSGGKLRPGERLVFHAAATDNGTEPPGRASHAIRLTKREEDGVWRVEKLSPLSTIPLLERVGAMPLPPYIRRRRGDDPSLEQLDRQRYQTIYAHDPGAVAAPTAGLHLTEELLDRLRARDVELAYLTLHVGMGTFAPVRAATLEAHTMHEEWFRIPASTLGRLHEARKEGQRIIPVGTTCVRALESLPHPPPYPTPEPAPDPETGDYTARTDLMIQPGFQFRFTDGLMTNFHLPRSTLLALVSARTGLGRLKELYQEAVEQGYRFYSYGDAMLVLPE